VEFVGFFSMLFTYRQVDLFLSFGGEQIQHKLWLVVSTGLTVKR